MRVLEAVGLWTAIAGYAFAFAALAAGWAFRGERARRAGWWLGGVALGAHALALIARWIATGHAPVMGVYENSLAGALFLPVIFGAVAWRFAPVRRGAPLVVAATLLLVGNGLMGRADGLALEPPYRSGWLAVHVTFAWFAFGSYLVASALCALFLWATRRKARVPEPDRRDVMDEISAKLIAFGFVSDSVMVASGAIWAHGLWGRYWGWDPIETWSLVTWLVYGAYLHLRFTLGWKGRKAAWVGLLAAAGVVMTFFGLGVVSEVHTQLL